MFNTVYRHQQEKIYKRLKVETLHPKEAYSYISKFEKMKCIDSPWIELKKKVREFTIMNDEHVNEV